MKRKVFILSLALVLLLQCAWAQTHNETTEHVFNQSKVTIEFFYSPTCPVCAKQKPFLDELEEKYPRLEIKRYEASKNTKLFEQTCEKYNTTTVGVPRTFIGDTAFVGFSRDDGDMKWYESYQAYYGYATQIENKIREQMSLAPLMCECEVLGISQNDPTVSQLLKEYPESKSSIYLENDTYTVGWWSPERINSNLNYPDAAVRIDAQTGEIIDSWTPSEPVPNLEKPGGTTDNKIFEIILGIFVAYGLAFIVFRNKMGQRYWVSGLLVLIVASIYAISESLSTQGIINLAEGFSFPGFTFIIALADGFNPCAFAVLAFLLSILTYTRSRKKMFLIGSTFILTSGLVYAIFIMLLLSVRATILTGNLVIDLSMINLHVETSIPAVIRVIVSLIAIGAGIINIKDYFFFKEGVSLTMDDEEQNRIFKKAGKLVQKVKRAETKTELLVAMGATVVLAAMVNLIELGCTFILPMEYIEVLLNNYPKPIGPTHFMYTLFYGLIYVIPLFAILGSFIHSFKSERMKEDQAKILKLVGGLLMLGLGLALLFKPELLMFK